MRAAVVALLFAVFGSPAFPGELHNAARAGDLAGLIDDEAPPANRHFGEIMTA